MFARITHALTPAHFRVILLLLAVAVLLLLPLPRGSREFHAIADLGHAPLFGVLAVLLVTWGRDWLPKSHWLACGLVWGAVSAMGLAAEYLQGQIGRHGSWDDAYANMLGASAFLLWWLAIHWRGRFARWGATLIGVCLLIVAWRSPTLSLMDALLQRREMPRIATFEKKLEFSRWHPQNCRLYQTTAWATDGQSSMLLELKPAKYSGVSLYWPVANWSPYESLEFDMLLRGDKPLGIVAKIEDETHNGDVHDRFNDRILLKPGFNKIRISLWDVAIAPHHRTLDLRRIKRLQFFTVDLKEQRRLYLDNIRLVP